MVDAWSAVADPVIAESLEAPGSFRPLGSRSRSLLRRLQGLSWRSRLGFILIFLSVAVAVGWQTGPFHRVEWSLGDLSYHCGVAYTMQGDRLQGEGPFRGLIS